MKTMANKASETSHEAPGGTPAPPEERLTRAPASTADPTRHAEAPAAPTDGALGVTQSQPPVAAPHPHRCRKWLLLAGVVVAVVVGGHFLVPLVDTALNTVSTDDAY